MRRTAAVVLFTLSAGALAHPGHGEAEVHLHGFSPELVLLALLVGVWLFLRSR